MALSVVEEPPSSSRLPSVPEKQLKALYLSARNAQRHDAQNIYRLIDSFTSDGTLLRRSYAEILQNIDTFTIVESDSGQFLGCAALHVYGQHLAEIRSIVVHPGDQGRGAGRVLVHALLDQAEAAGIGCVCLFTRIPAFFERFCFRVVDRYVFSDKVAKDCVHCSRQNACDETAMALGELPAPRHWPADNFFYSRHHANLVQITL